MRLDYGRSYRTIQLVCRIKLAAGIWPWVLDVNTTSLGESSTVIWLVFWNMAFIVPYIGKNIPTDSFFQRGRSSTNQWLLLSPDRKPVQHGSSLFWVSQGGACWKHCITQRNIGKQSDTDDLCLKQSNSVQYYSKTVAFIVLRFR